MFDQIINQITETLQDQFLNNDLFAGGAILMVAGAILAVIRKWPIVIWGWIKKQSMIVIDIPDKDIAFDWVVKWLAEGSYSKNRARLLTVKTRRDEDDREDGRPQIIFSPAPGTHYLWYKGRFMILSRERQDPKNEDSKGGGSREPFREYFTIRLLGRDRSIAQTLLEEAREIADPKQERKVVIWNPSWDCEGWHISTRRTPRHLDTIVLRDGLMDWLVKDIQEFLDSQKWYEERGIPYRRGYMFYGPPGNGKSSAIAGLATHFNFDVGPINLQGTEIDDAGLSNIITKSPKHMLMLMEDIDCLVHQREMNKSGDNKMRAPLTFSGLLNAIDGVASPEGQIIIMTTNHIEKLDPALLRPGRCDVHVHFGNADRNQRVRMFERFYPEYAHAAAEFADNTPEGVSMAQLQGFFLKHRNTPTLAVERASLVKEDVSHESKTTEARARTAA